MNSEEISNLPTGTILLEPQSMYNSAIVGFDQKSGRLIYDYVKIINVELDNRIMNGDQDTEELYWNIVSEIDFNILGMNKPRWPLIKEEDHFLNGDT